MAACEGSVAEGSAGSRLAAVAREVLGWRQLRPLRRQAMQSVLDGRDTLLVMPIGAGKSAAYQVPALPLLGPTVIVSPLIALQYDQVAGLLRRTHAPGAVAVDSVRRDPRPSGGAFPVGSTVRHREWGEGTVLQAEADRITVLFASTGYRTLSLEAVREQSLIEKTAG